MNGKGLVTLSEISLHFLKNGMHEVYTSWRYHVESSVQAEKLTHKDNTTTECVDYNDVTACLNENITTYRDENIRAGMDENVEAVVDENVTAGVDENVTVGLDENVGTSMCGQNKRSVAEKAREPLYPSCPNGKSAMYAAIMVNNIKTQYGISDNGVTAILELIKDSVWKVSNVRFSKDNSSLVKCSVCQEPRYVRVFNDERKLTRVAQKTLRHFPIIARLKRLYSIPWIVEEMIWHYKAQKDVNIMRHPVDSIAWRCADNFCPEFSKEARNVTLGIATDGFNPNGCFGLNYSCCPVILCSYNLPPSMYMKREFSMLCFLILGPRAPGKYIDVYLKPLIEELKELWNDGIMTFDSFTNSEFLLKTRFLWVIHDFPALGTLSGCVTHGYYACPTCGEEKVSEWLSYSKKICYIGHRRWLPSKQYRYDKKNFSGGIEEGKAPWPLTGLQFQDIVKDMKRKQGKVKPPGKKRKRGEEGQGVDEDVSDHSLFSRRSILHDLPNLGSNAIRHCTDVVHR
ncbi:uncharacterized protein LOC113312741 [Papaver somniferum]|uniref:uncharacterized protein LOC113312741 n=1 Tax=Papaver somniferum TaxID=3469 RepID=UPI000E6FA8BF|nr:uncharacterized protein LOC113312741 [Papaver somniferum]